MSGPQNPRVTQADKLRAVLRYEPETGKLFWRARPASMFSDKTCGGAEAFAKAWNTRYAGREALNRKDRHGYMRGTLFNKVQKAHRVAWAIYYGEWPEGQIDHINGDRSDNRIVNLRCVSNAENCRNRKTYSNNTSGVVGVRCDKTTGKWDAFIRVDFRQIHLGRFPTKQEAAVARKDAERTYGFHRNHGRAA